MFGLGWQELLIILIIALIIFGPRKLPEVGKSLGQAINGFKQSIGKTTNEVKRELKDIESSTSSSVKNIDNSTDTVKNSSSDTD